MPAKCCAPKCRGNYAGGPKVSTFAFPKDQDLFKKWLGAIKRADFTPTNNSRVCELHFREDDIERSTKFYTETGEVLDVPLKIPRLVQYAIPCKLPGCPEYLSKNDNCHRESPASKKQRLENDSLRQTLAESIASANAYDKLQALVTLDDIVGKFTDKHLPLWSFTRTPHYVCFMHVIETPHPSTIYMVSIAEDMQLSIFYRNVELKSITSSTGQVKLPVKINTVNSLEEILNVTLDFCDKGNKDTVVEKCKLAIDVLESISNELPEKVNCIRFLQEQVKLLNLPKTGVRYSWETILFCSLLHAISPHAYKFLRNANLILLPCSSTVTKVCNNALTDPRLEQNDTKFLQYVSTKMELLGANDKLITLMVDEMHLKSYIDYKGGNLVGGTYNSTTCATSACVFMINSLLSSYKDVVHILPVKSLHAEELHFFIKKVVLGLEEIGFEVLVVVSDNHTVNRKAMSMFADPPVLLNEYQHPKDSSRPLFFAIDSVHIIKNLRNNWINKKNQEMIYPDFQENVQRTASFEALKTMHSKESNQLLKFGWTLSLKALYPTSIERQNVKLALQVINPMVVTALRELGPKIPLSNYDDTAAYIEILCRWWDIANVKTPFKGIRHRNPYQQPIRKDSHHIFDFLNNMISWLDRWSTSPSGSKLTHDTHVALRETTAVYLKIAHYCLHTKNFNYVLPGQIQTDKLEERFGKYRYQSGSQYHISLRQIFETENKFRMMSVVPLILKSKAYGDIKITKEDMSSFFSENEPKDVEEFKISASLQDVAIEESEIDQISENIWPSLAYIGGYASYSLIKHFKCEYCKVFLLQFEENEAKHTNLITANDRGGLCYPSNDVVVCAAYTYLTVEKLLKMESIFLQEKEHRKILTALAFENLNGLDLNLFLGHNCSKHSTKSSMLSFVWPD